MHSSTLLVALFAGAFASASMIPRGQPNCNGEVYNNICCVNGEWAGQVISSAITSVASDGVSYYSAHSTAIQAALSSAASNGAAFISSNSASLQTFVSKNSAAIESGISSLKSSLAPFEATVTPPADPFGKRSTIVIHTSSINNAINEVHNDLENFVATWSPPDVVFDKRAVSVVSQGLTCYGQAVVTLTATNAASLITSATSAAGGTKYYANGLSGAFATSTSSSTAGAAMVTRGPMLAVGGAAIAFAFAAM